MPQNRAADKKQAFLCLSLDYARDDTGGASAPRSYCGVLGGPPRGTFLEAHLLGKGWSAEGKP